MQQRQGYPRRGRIKRRLIPVASVLTAPWCYIDTSGVVEYCRNCSNLKPWHIHMKYFNTQMQDRLERLKRSGRIDYIRGKQLTDNPFRFSDSVKASGWELGWKEARDMNAPE